MKSEMSRAEKLALGNYPPKYVGILDKNATPAIDMNEDARAAYIEGYEQAEKDLAPTWHSISYIFALIESLMCEQGKPAAPRDEEFCKEVLKRYNK